MTAIHTRTPTPNDATAITAIDRAGLVSGHASFRANAHDWSSFSTTYLQGRALALVATDGQEVTGWAGVSATSARDVYRGVGEVSIYISPAQQGRGIGTHLLGALIMASEQAGYWTLIAQIFPENASSLALHRAHGFADVGLRRKLGQMGYGPLAGRWRDVILLERRSASVG